MRIIDISMELRPGMIHWPDTTAPERMWEHRIVDGDANDASRWLIPSHDGTHLDAPSHVIRGGAQAADADLERLIGPARVVDVGDEVTAIDASVVARLDLAGVSRVLLRTSNSSLRIHATEFDPGYVALTGDGATALAQAGMRTVAVDYLSVELYGQPRPEAHLALFEAGIAVIEGCDLHDVEPGDYLLCCLPLRLLGSEAAPARAVLIEDAAW